MNSFFKCLSNYLFSSSYINKKKKKKRKKNFPFRYLFSIFQLHISSLFVNNVKTISINLLHIAVYKKNIVTREESPPTTYRTSKKWTDLTSPGLQKKSKSTRLCQVVFAIRAQYQWDWPSQSAPPSG